MKRRLSILLLVCFLVISCICVNGNGIESIQRLYVFPKGDTGYAYVNNSNGSILINHSKKADSAIYLFENNKITKTVRNAILRELSHDGDFYSCYYDESFCIFNSKNDKLIQKIKVPDEGLSSMYWSWDSKYLNFTMQDDIYQINIATGKKEKVLTLSGVSRPVPLLDNNEIIFMQEKAPNAVTSSCNLVKYNFVSKKLESVKLPPIKNLFIYEDFTASPNGNIVIFYSHGDIYVVNLAKQQILDQINIPGFKTGHNPQIGDFSWDKNGMFVIFTYYSSETGICKYTLPR